MIELNQKDYTYFAERLFRIDSPTGYTHHATAFIKAELEAMGYQTELSNKGTLKVCVEGEDASKTVATSAHIDTLGLMVRSIKANGALALTKLGGPLTPTLDGEYCRIITRTGKQFTGTILSLAPSVHVFPDAATQARDIEHLEVRLDERVQSEKDVRSLGIENGDIVCIDTKFTMTPSGFLKTRFIDDKASVILLLLTLKYFAEHRIRPRYRTLFYFSVYEEVGHGASCVDEDISEFVTCDMGCVGLDLAGNEYAVSICAKDSGGPYDYELTTRLITLAKTHGLNYTVDIFPMYGSDIGAAYRAGKDLKGALIGPGVSASHGMERTHEDAIANSLKLLYLYLTE